eukprot:COSAG02_NODE_7618_length_2931_cov_186.388449_4_plen_150_part_00
MVLEHYSSTVSLLTSLLCNNKPVPNYKKGRGSCKSIVNCSARYVPSGRHHVAIRAPAEHQDSHIRRIDKFTLAVRFIWLDNQTADARLVVYMYVSDIDGVPVQILAQTGLLEAIEIRDVLAEGQEQPPRDPLFKRGSRGVADLTKISCG